VGIVLFGLVGGQGCGDGGARGRDVPVGEEGFEGQGEVREYGVGVEEDDEVWG